MGTAEILIAAILLTTPPAESIGDTLPAPVPDAWRTVLAPHLAALAMDAEIIDPRELKEWRSVAQGDGVRVGTVGEDIAGLQAAYQSLRDAPLAREAERFPSAAVLNDAMRINRQARDYLESRLALDLFWSNELGAAIGECDAAQLVLTTALAAQETTSYVGVRREELQRLRRLIGPEAFYRGVLTGGVRAEPVPLRKRMPKD